MMSIHSGVGRRATALLADASADQAFLRSVDTALRTTLAHLPVLLVFGRASPTVKGGFPASWSTRFPAAWLFFVEGAHHFPMMDDPVRSPTSSPPGGSLPSSRRAANRELRHRDETEPNVGGTMYDVGHHGPKRPS